MDHITPNEDELFQIPKQDQLIYQNLINRAYELDRRQFYLKQQIDQSLRQLIQSRKRITVIVDIRFSWIRLWYWLLGYRFSRIAQIHNQHKQRVQEYNALIHKSMRLDQEQQLNGNRLYRISNGENAMLVILDSDIAQP